MYLAYCWGVALAGLGSAVVLANILPPSGLYGSHPTPCLLRIGAGSVVGGFGFLLVI